ncbi:MAG: HAD-IC family P-type ATPase, partial [Phycisphaeraceae bacterium]|nr:HAD-IC family P-type ATPase [Phycisphaeraceae bacterium]
VLVRSNRALATAATVDTVVLDKTGTLTEPAADIASVTSASLDPDTALALAAAVETTCDHPLGRALQIAATDRQLPLPPATDGQARPGCGVTATVDGRPLAVVNRRGLADWDLTPESPSNNDETLTLYLVETDTPQILARLQVTERLHPHVAPVIDRLKQRGLNVHLLTGDGPVPAERIADKLGISFEAGLLPPDKAQAISQLQREGRRVMAVGDGINDGPMLAAADVGVAVASATDLATAAGDVALVTDRLDTLMPLLTTAADCRRRIRSALAWAFGYNSVGLTLAAVGLLNPVIAAIAMVGSSLLVLRLATGGFPTPSASESSDATSVDPVPTALAEGAAAA